ncbi:MAG: 6-carboxytetrahydropterin synthase [Deltaproteobacteria bacterium]|nr:6-carboxytetrahydropterin synthase [Deltaproteobacteria bacterium]MBW2393369.1 6-carboxytetrahydropterin synthase [Deltaproteobacteria bacterium]
MTKPRLIVKLAKEDFKFSAAHFTVFPSKEAERLHGHNYRVRIEIEGTDPGPDGLLVPVAEVKANLRALCASLDERTLVPEKSPHLEVNREADAIEIAFGERRYRLPAADTRLLPLQNVTMELLATHLWHELAPSLTGGRVERLVVEVEETAGQSASYAGPIGGG